MVCENFKLATPSLFGELGAWDWVAKIELGVHMVTTLATPSRGLAHLVMLGQFYDAAARSLPAAFEQLSALVTQPDLFHQSLWALASFTSVLSSDAIAKFSSLYHQRLE